MRNSIGVEGLETEVRSFVHEAAVFGTQGKVLAEEEVAATAVYKGTSRLRLYSGNQGVPRGTKDQGAAFGENVRTQAKSSRGRQAKDQPAGRLVDAALDAGTRRQRHRISLRVADESVSGLCRQPAVQIVAIAEQESSGVGGLLPDSLSGRVLRIEAGALQTDFRARFLSERDCGEQADGNSRQNGGTPCNHSW